MKEEELSELYLKFPAILKEKLKNGEVSFPKETQFKYMPITAYRAIERTEEDSTPINRNDFRSYAEMKKKKQEAVEWILQNLNIMGFLFLPRGKLLKIYWHFLIQRKR